MLSLGPVAFAAPYMLLALAAVPVIYWLLRLLPPSPRRIAFPPIRLLADLIQREETSHRTPWWLILFRLAIAALIIVALARPVLNASTDLPGSGPVLLLVDNGWAAAGDWEVRRRVLHRYVERAERQNRPVIVLPLATADHRPGQPSGATTDAAAGGAADRSVLDLLRPQEAHGAIDALTPVPWPGDEEAALALIDDLNADGAMHSVWVSSGLDGGSAAELAVRLQRLGSLDILRPEPGRTARLLHPPSTSGPLLSARVERAETAGVETVAVRLLASDGRLLSRQPGTFADGDTTVEITFDVPPALRNEATEIVIEGQDTAGAVALLDERWRRRTVGIAEAGSGDSQPLLSPSHYLTRALEPFNDVRTGSIEDLIQADVAVLALPDIGSPSAAEVAALEPWIRGGGVLLRFAGPLLAEGGDSLLPVRLRPGDRTLGGPLSWTHPMPLAPFDPDSPLQGLDIPEEVRVSRQVLAEPTLDLSRRTWARLTDGTPLITAAQMGGDGGGWIILVHTTADPAWSNLPISGLFVGILRRIVELSSGVPWQSATDLLPPVRSLDGFGRLGPPLAEAISIRSDAFETTAVGPTHPPGYYGTEDARRALNLATQIEPIQPLPAMPIGVGVSGFEMQSETDLKPWLLAAALMLLAVDLAVALRLRGLLGLRKVAAGGAVALLLIAAAPIGARADVIGDDTDLDLALRAANHIYLAYVVTGVPQSDETSRAGLEGLAAVLRNRTAVEAEGAIGVDPARDELAFFPLLYWRIVPEHPDLPRQAIDRLNDYLRYGGTILFDTGDQAIGGAITGGPSGTTRLRQLIDGLDIPPLEPVPPDHVLTRSFYLLQDFPGRHAGGVLWVQATDERINDGVSSVLVGDNDWSAAWAVDSLGRPLNPVVPGGERQREMAFRVGVNLVIYALTGNYKADQVHVPAILERLGQ